MDRNKISFWLQGLAGSHALKFDRETDRADFFSTLIRSPSAHRWWAIPADGGLLEDYSLLENIFLPANATDDQASTGRMLRWQKRLDLAGIPPLPYRLSLTELSPWQKRLAAFLRAVVADAPALIFDDTCYGLSKLEYRQAILLHRFYQQYFQFRPTIYSTLSDPPAELDIPNSNVHHHDIAFVTQ